MQYGPALPRVVEPRRSALAKVVAIDRGGVKRGTEMQRRRAPSYDTPVSIWSRQHRG